MSHVATVWAWKQRVGGGMTKLVLLQIADSADCNGYSSYSIEAIARHAECSTRTVQRHLDILVDKLKILRRVRQGGRVNGRNITAQYRCCFELIAQVEKSEPVPTARDEFLERQGALDLTDPDDKPLPRGTRRRHRPRKLVDKHCVTHLLGVTARHSGGVTQSPIPGNRYPENTKRSQRPVHKPRKRYSDEVTGMLPALPDAPLPISAQERKAGAAYFGAVRASLGW